jgi:hypothetical protein
LALLWVRLLWSTHLFRFRAQDVVQALGQAMLLQWIPGCVRSENGSKCIAMKVRAFLRENGTRRTYIAIAKNKLSGKISDGPSVPNILMSIAIILFGLRFTHP